MENQYSNIMSHAQPVSVYIPSKLKNIICGGNGIHSFKNQSNSCTTVHTRFSNGVDSIHPFTNMDESNPFNNFLKSSGFFFSYFIDEIQ